MFNIFNSKQQDVKTIRASILNFIKEQLQHFDGGEGHLIKEIILYIKCEPNEKSMYESAVNYGANNKFKTDEVQKVADDFAISLPQDWDFEVVFTEQFPNESIQSGNKSMALQINLRSQPIINEAPAIYHATITILAGEAEHKTYEINRNEGKVNIGRDKKIINADGLVRENKVVFLAESLNSINKSISRQHCHIAFSEEKNAFLLFADEGGIPPNNKTKIKSQNGQMAKIQTTGIGYRLQNGDNIILGDAAILEFKLG